MFPVFDHVPVGSYYENSSRGGRQSAQRGWRGYAYGAQIARRRHLHLMPEYVRIKRDVVLSKPLTAPQRRPRAHSACTGIVCLPLLPPLLVGVIESVEFARETLRERLVATVAELRLLACDALEPVVVQAHAAAAHAALKGGARGQLRAVAERAQAHGLLVAVGADSQ